MSLRQDFWYQSRIFLLLSVASLGGCAASVAAHPASSPPPSPAVLAVPGDADLARTRDLQAAGIDPARLRCRPVTVWSTSLRAESQAAAAELLEHLRPRLGELAPEQQAALADELRELVMWRLVRYELLQGENHNFGVLPLRGRTWTDAQGKPHPLLIFRTGLTPRPAAPDSCFGSLLAEGGVRHVVNLFDGDIPAADLVAAERTAAAAAGASYFAAEDGGAYGTWRDLLKRHPEPGEPRTRATLAVARLIREQLLAPGGEPPRGNLHVHCGGGMHRTGMVLGVVDRCLNGSSPEEVRRRYRAHVDYRDEAHPGGAEPENLRFIEEFDCRLLEGPLPAAS
ncbi:MAG: hypothetical protein RBU45_23075 [Myxococcota bacterium]|nr:hypothetical protein [Myxococcota bacterium]